MTTTLEKPNLTLLVCDPKARSAVPHRSALWTISPGTHDIEQWRNLFVLATATCLADVADSVTAANRQNQLRALFVRCDVDSDWLPRMFEIANLRTMRNTIVHSDFRVPNRVLRAWEAGAQTTLIADAQVVGNDLLVMSCEPETYRIPFPSVPALKKLPKEERGHFEIADDGSFIHWPSQDIHLDLDSLLVAIDPARRAKADRVKRAYGQRYGAAIARLRNERHLRQTDIPGLSEREVRRIEESGEITTESLRKLAEAHEMTLPDYLNAIASHAVPKPEEEALVTGNASGLGRPRPKKK